MVSSLTHRGQGFDWLLLAGALSFAAGVFPLVRPVAGLISQAVILAIYFGAASAPNFLLASSIARNDKRPRRSWGYFMAGTTDMVLGSMMLFGGTE